MTPLFHRLRLIVLATLFITAQLATAVHAIEHRFDQGHIHYASCDLFSAAEQSSLACSKADTQSISIRVESFTPFNEAQVVSTETAAYHARAPPTSL